MSGMRQDTVFHRLSSYRHWREGISSIVQANTQRARRNTRKAECKQVYIKSQNCLLFSSLDKDGLLMAVGVLAIVMPPLCSSDKRTLVQSALSLRSCYRWVSLLGFKFHPAAVRGKAYKARFGTSRSTHFLVFLVWGDSFCFIIFEIF